MKLNLIPAIIAIAVAALLGLLASLLCNSTTNDTAIGITSGVSLAVTLLPMMAIRTNDDRLNINMRVVSTIFTAILIVLTIIMCCISVSSLKIYYIISGLILLAFIGALYSLFKASNN